ncbi:MAG: nucleotide sugar dehydrogenase [Deltaproteobacteria bacterium]|nr:nucleotide sugar dehydrogenase [Deltaproteobacteria bacterium]
MIENIKSKIDAKKAVIGVIGLGYVGLPLICEFVKNGFYVVGFDTDRKKIDKLNRSESYIGHIPPAKLCEMNKSGKFRATSSFAEAKETDILIICVPTPLTKNREPDMSYIVSSCNALAPYVHKGHLISLESTTYPGTCQEVLKPIFENGSGLTANKDFFIVFSPEREDPNNKDYNISSIPKIVGSDSSESLEAACLLYGHVVNKTIPVSSTRVAEAAKLIENIFRGVNIALVNELKMLFHKMGIDVWEAINAAATKPFGFMPFYPGPGLGGHCIPIDPFYLTWKAREYDFSTKFIELAGEINTKMPHYVADRVVMALNEHKKPIKGSKILLVGLAYKKDVDDMRESPSLKLMELLEGKGAIVYYHDPFILSIPVNRDYPQYTDRRSVSMEHADIYDCILIATAHSNIDYASLQRRAKLIVDTRNVISKENNVYSG